MASRPGLDQDVPRATGRNWNILQHIRTGSGIVSAKWRGGATWKARARQMRDRLLTCRRILLDSYPPFSSTRAAFIVLGSCADIVTGREGVQWENRARDR